MTTLPVAPAYRDAIKVAILLQVPLAVLLTLILDGGYSAGVGGCVMLGFWIGVGVVVFRRPRNPTPLDLFYVRWGYAPLLVLCVVAGTIFAMWSQ
jgi:hypothetical protein